jgi:2-methylcitrate dehydratase
MVTLTGDTNQAAGLAEYAINFIGGSSEIHPDVKTRVVQFHTDAVLCGISALALKCNAPVLLRDEALEYTCSDGPKVFGSSINVRPEKAVVANCSAVREWDSNGTVFGYNEARGKAYQAGEFGHNDFYSVVIAAAQKAKNVDGKKCLRGMVCVDEIRGRLAEVFSLKTFKIDHVVHGGIASACVYGALIGAPASAIESAIGLYLAHYIPFRAIRAGKQLSDSKGASAAISAEVAVLSVERALRGFKGPQDIFRNPECLFRIFQADADSKVSFDLKDKVRWGVGRSPFDLYLTDEGRDFALMDMHFKLGLYEHQSAGAIQGLIDLFMENPEIRGQQDALESIEITAYEPAYGIIGDPAKKDPKTRQSADHSMAFIVSRLLKKLFTAQSSSNEDLWEETMLTPHDYSSAALHDEATRKFMKCITFTHGGPTYDAKYPEGIPTSLKLVVNSKTYESPLVMFPAGHAKNKVADLARILNYKNLMMGNLSFQDGGKDIIKRLNALETLSAGDIGRIYEFDYGSILKHEPIDGI